MNTQIETAQKFVAHVVYAQPEYEELKRRFPDYVDPGYEGKRFDPIERCKVVSKESREVAFEYFHMDRGASTDEVLAEMGRMGLRPALYEELLGFDLKYPDEQRKHFIVALGSTVFMRAFMSDDHFVACLSHTGNDQGFDLRWFADDWDHSCWFLAVRE